MNTTLNQNNSAINHPHMFLSKLQQQTLWLKARSNISDILIDINRIIIKFKDTENSDYAFDFHGGLPMSEYHHMIDMRYSKGRIELQISNIGEYLQKTIFSELKSKAKDTGSLFS